jgi:hypothetical protein
MVPHFLSRVFIVAVLLRRKEPLQFLIKESSVRALKFVGSLKMEGGRGLRHSPHIPKSLYKRKEN